MIYKLETDGLAAFSLGAFSATGEFRLGVTLVGACQRAGVQPEVVDRYVDGLLRLMPNAARKPRGTGGIKLAGKDGKGEPPIEWLVGKEDEFLAVMDGVIADLRRSLEPKPC